MTASEPSAIPPQAITDAEVIQLAAEAALAEVPCTCGTPSPPHMPTCARPIVATWMFPILEAAQPHLTAAERERCAQLAEQHNAAYRLTCDLGTDCPYGPPGPVTHLHPFADLLRKQS